MMIPYKINAVRKITGFRDSEEVFIALICMFWKRRR